MNFHSGLDMGRDNGIQSYKERVFALNDSRLLKSTIQSDDWCGDEECKAALKPILMGLCTKYLLEAKGTKESKIKDPVGNFHIQNGAQMARLNWNADPSLNGIEKSAGIMINYQYFPTRTFQSALNYASTGSFNVSTFFRKAAFPSTIMQSSTKIASSSSSSLGGGSENKKDNGDKDDDAAYYIISPKNAALADGAIPSENKNVASKL
uniref:Malonyl-CoA decarboxylase C-terminal domain-containing protein n=1 Tax=Heterosigma akashiwo TaxID=2829 RepID=A0A7S3UQ31_HETAK